MPGAESPLVNEFKCDFIKRRMVETFLGGPKIRGVGQNTVAIHLTQLFLHITPLLTAIVFISFTEAGLLSVVNGSYFVGGILLVFTIIVQIFSWNCQVRTAVVAPVKSKLVQMTEEDNLDASTCCSSETLQLVIPIKKYKWNILFHAVVSCIMCGLAFHYLAPAVLNVLFTKVWINYLLFLWGWVVVCTAQYSLTTSAPPEPVVFHPLDFYESAALMRPFYVLLFVSVHIVSCYHEWWNEIDRVVHVAFAFLPLLWFMGILPPLDALFPWLGEQIYIYLLGGSAMASDVRLFIMLMISVATVVIIFFIPTFIPCLAVAAVTGYIFSLDLCNIWNYFLQLCKKESTDSSKYSLAQNPSPKKPTNVRCNVPTMVLYTGIFLMATLVFILSKLDRGQRTENNLKNSYGYILVSVAAFNTVLTSVQQVYIVHGFFLNPLYPTDVTQPSSFHRRMKPLNCLGYLRIVLVYVGAPLLMISYLGIFIPHEDKDVFLNKSAWQKIIFTVTIVRAFRWIWQHTENALLEMTVVHYLNYFELLPTDYGMAEELLMAAFIHNRGRQLWHKLHLAFIVLVTSMSLAKQRQRYSGLLAILNLWFLPIVWLIIVSTCILSAPLLPLFTLPIFLVGFPRPVRTWPGKIKRTAAISGDSVYYKQLTPSLVVGLQRCHLLGSLGNVIPGDYFLVHFEDRLIFVLVLEKGFGFCTFSVKGLELQETSCHAVEATHLDLLLTTAFEANQDHHARRNPLCMNPEPFHVFHPLTTVFLVTHSDTRNVLTGLIDSPDTLKLIGSSYVKALVWVLLHQRAKKYLEDQMHVQEKSPAETIDTVQPILSLNNRPRTAESLSKLPRAKKVEACLDELSRSSSPIKSPRPKSTDRRSSAPAVASPPINSNNNGWSDDDEDPLGDDSALPVRHPISVLTQQPDVPSRPGTTTVLYATHIPGTIGDNIVHELDFGLPAVDVNVGEKGDGKTSPQIKRRTLTVIGNPVQYSTPGLKLAPLFDWLELPFDRKEMNAFRDQYPIKWYHFVLKLVASKYLKMDDKSLAELEVDEGLLQSYREIVLSCHAVVNLLAFKNDSQTHLRPSHVYKTFNGEIAWSPYQDWILHNKELHALALKAYGYATKLALDQILMGESGTDEEVLEYLMDYGSTWHIGSDSNNSWGENILQEKPNLFSLGFNPIQRTFTSHLLTMQELPVRLGRLNPEVVRGIWASLAFELLYLTNDDEERYSIQAHPIILRNLIVQAADSPLGYPIFTSEAISTGPDCVWRTRTK